MEAAGVLVARWILSLVFLAAGLGKQLERPGEAEGRVEYGLLPPRWARLHRRVLPWIEMGTGLLLLSGVNAGGSPVTARAPVILAAALLIAFTAVFGIALVQGREVECHCFGRFGGGRVTGWTLARNLVLLALAGVAFAAPRAGAASLGDSAVSLTTLPSLLLALATVSIAAMIAEAASLTESARRARRDRTARAAPQSIRHRP